MSINKFNASGYYDPTAYEALTMIESKMKKSAYKPIVYICSPFAGEIERNTDRARRYSRFAVTMNTIPLTPHLLYPQFMQDSDKQERELALFMGLVLLTKCTELWCFGSKISEGMAIEIEKAKHRNMHIRYFNDRCEEVGANAKCT